MYVMVREITGLSWADSQEILEALEDAREYTGISKINIRADDGQGFLKIWGMFIQDKHNPQFVVVTTDEEENMEDDNDSKRIVCKDGGTAAKTGKITPEATD